MDISDTLRKLRLKFDYTQEKLGEVLSVEYSTYGKYEKGVSKLRLDQAKILADFYNLTLDELIHYEEPNYSSLQKSSELRESEAYYKKKSNKTISLMIELDGSEEVESKWISMIRQINQVVKATI